jgi:hypothetical protein
MGIKEELKLSKQLANKIDGITKKIDKLINILAVTTETRVSFWAQWRIDLKKQYKRAIKVFSAWSVIFIPKYYDKIVSDTLNDLKQKKSTRNIEIQSMEIQAIKIKDINITKTRNTDKNVQTKNSLVSESINGYTVAMESGEKELIRLSSLKQQQNIGQAEIDALIESELFSGGATYDIKAKEIEKLLTKALDGKYIAVVDKNGVTRMWNVKSYTEMFIRTKLRETASVAVVNTALTVGSDLIQVSSHNTTTPICIPFEGKIFSISGQDKDFAHATDVPPFHPNCIHSITIVFRSVLERRVIGPYSDFSKGKTEIHPTRKSHIPVSQRRVDFLGKLKKDRGQYKMKWRCHDSRKI